MAGDDGTRSGRGGEARAAGADPRGPADNSAMQGVAGERQGAWRKWGKKVLDPRRSRSIVSFPSFNALRETNGAKEESSARLTVPSEHFSLFGGEKY
jgi:hypothetical protein